MRLYAHSKIHQNYYKPMEFSVLNIFFFFVTNAYISCNYRMEQKTIKYVFLMFKYSLLVANKITFLINS